MISKFVRRAKYFKFRTLQKYSTLADVKPDLDSPLKKSSHNADLQQQWHASKPFKSLPGPTKLQTLRAFLRGGDFHGVPVGEIMRMCRQRYGDIFLLPGSFGLKTKVITYNVSDHEKIYRTGGAYPVRPGLEAILYHRMHRQDGIYDKDNLGLVANGPQWGELRHVVNPILMQPNNAVLYIDPTQRVNEDFIQRIRTIRDPSSLEVPQNVMVEIQHLVFDTVAAIALDKDMGVVRKVPQAREALELFQNLDIFSRSFFDLGFRPTIYKYIKTPSYKRFEKAADAVIDSCRKFIGDALQRVEKEGPAYAEDKSVLGKLLKINRKVAEILAVDMLMGSVENTTSAFSGIMLCMAKNPEKQEKLRQEVLKNIGKSAKFTLENMKQLPYLRACIKEALRLYPVHFGIMRSSAMDLSLSGYQIPKDTIVFLASREQLKEASYFPNPEEFVPERWLRSNAEDPISVKNVKTFLYVPFGFGPRACVAKRVFNVMAEITLANVVRHFRLEYNHSTENAFSNQFVNTCVIPLNLKFEDLK